MQCLWSWWQEQWLTSLKMMVLFYAWVIVRAIDLGLLNLFQHAMWMSHGRVIGAQDSCWSRLSTLPMRVRCQQPSYSRERALAWEPAGRGNHLFLTTHSRIEPSVPGLGHQTGNSRLQNKCTRFCSSYQDLEDFL